MASKTDSLTIFLGSPASPLPIARVPGQFPPVPPNSPCVFIRPEGRKCPDGGLRWISRTWCRKASGPAAHDLFVRFSVSQVTGTERNHIWTERNPIWTERNPIWTERNPIWTELNPIRHRKGAANDLTGAGQVPNDAPIYQPYPM